MFVGSELDTLDSQSPLVFTHQVGSVEGLHVDVTESVVTKSVEDVSSSGVSLSTSDCLETGNTGGHREKNKVKTKPNKNKIKEEKSFKISRVSNRDKTFVN